MRVVVFTAIMVDPNDPNPKPIDTPGPFDKIPGMDYILLTNVPNAHQVFKNTSWTIRPVTPPPEHVPKRHYAIYANRYYKWHPAQTFPDYHVAIYVDGFQVPDASKASVWWRLAKDTMHPLDRETLQDSPVCIIQCKHPTNDCIYKELRSIVNARKDTAARMMAVNLYLESNGFPKDIGLMWNGCYVLALHKNPLITKLFNDLYEDMIIYTYRDQSLYMYHLYKNRVNDYYVSAPLDKIVKDVDTNKNHIYI